MSDTNPPPGRPIAGPPGPGEIRVRMYRQGLGDCFLLSIPRDDGGAGHSHLLIDCGVLAGTKDGADRIRLVADDIAETTGNRLDVLVVTHQHWDHVSGFLQAEEVFARKLKIGEVWLAWTEDLGHDLAKSLREKKARAARALEQARMRLAGPGFARPASQSTRKVLEALNLFDGEADETLGIASGTTGRRRRTTAEAMRWAREGTGAVVRYFTPGEGPFPVPGASSVQVYVLGPPEDATLLKKSDPSKSAPEVYSLAAGMDTGFIAALDAQTGEGDAARPFDPSFELSTKDAEQDPFFGKRYFDNVDDWRTIEDDWIGSAERLALHLDNDTNNTSLSLAFELVPSRRVLLFPGDAQVGNWLSWKSVEWPRVKREGSEVRVDAADLLARTVLYKVSHHASHNATLRDLGLERMSSRELVALIPVSQERAKDLEWDMPFGPLLARLIERTRGRVIRADTGPPAERHESLSELLWAEFLDRTAVEPLFIDHRVSMR